MSKRNLLLCFDAFDTLFTPKRPISQQYGEVARSLGLGGFSDEQLQASFKNAFKKESIEHPNYGKAKGLRAEQWWTNIIHATFQPLTAAGQVVPKDLAPRLLHRFSSDEGYVLYPDVLPLIRRLRGTSTRSDTPRVVIGVITNSDDRVPDVLTSLGLRVSPARYGHSTQATTDEHYDIDFAVMSYDVGHEKPDKRIFAAAEKLFKHDPAVAGTDVHLWEKVYVGDDLEKDVAGALNAGWKAIYVDRKSKPINADNVLWHDKLTSTILSDALTEANGRALGFGSLAELAQRLPQTT